MECNFFVGQRVVCVDTAGLSGPGTLPVCGTVYTIREIRVRDGGIGLTLAEIVNEPRTYIVNHAGATAVVECCFLVRRFRPVHDTSHQVNAIKELLAPIFKGETVKVST